jgi:hypothetical protein
LRQLNTVTVYGQEMINTFIQRGKPEQFEERTRPLRFTEKQPQVNRCQLGRRYLFHCRVGLSQEVVNPAFLEGIDFAGNEGDFIIGLTGIFIKPD